MHYALLLSSFCASVAFAIQVTEPGQNVTWTDSDKNTIKWKTVTSDPSSIDIVLVNNNVNPPISKSIATDIKTSSGKYETKSLSEKGGEGYQINLYSSDNTKAILAQSQQFTLKHKAASSASSTSSPSATDSAPASSKSTKASNSSGTMNTVSLAGLGLSGLLAFLL